MKAKIILNLLFIFSSVFSYSNNRCIESKDHNNEVSHFKKTYDDYNNCDLNRTVDVTLTLRDTRGYIHVPNERLVTEIDLGITFKIYIKDYRTRDSGQINLHLDFPVYTTLDPIKIPPVNPDASRSNAKNTSISRNGSDPYLFKTIYMPSDAYNENEGEEFIPLDVGQHSFSFELKKGDSVTLYKTSPRYFDAYNPSWGHHIKISKFSAFENIENNDILLRTNLYSYAYEACGTKLSYYISDYKGFDNKSTLVASTPIDPIRFDRKKEVDFMLDRSIYQQNVGRYITIILSDNNTISPINEYLDYKYVEILPIDQIEKAAPDLYISDAKLYQSANSNYVTISCTVTNNGNMTSPISKVDFHYEAYPRKYINSATIPTLQPGESSVVNIQVTRQYYNLRLHLRSITMVLDPENTITELNETDNEKSFRFPYIGTTPTPIFTVSPNPFDHEINFNFSINYPNRAVKINIYNQQGVLMYHTYKFYRQPGEHSINIVTHNFPSNNIYYYSFMLGVNDTYYPFNGTIIKN